MALYRELLRAEPTLEDVARRLYRCYGQLGDRVSLVREHHRLQQALQEAYGRPEDGGDPALTAPEPETVATFEEVLALLDAGDGPAPSQHLRERPREPTGRATGGERDGGADGDTDASGPLMQKARLGDERLGDERLEEVRKGYAA